MIEPATSAAAPPIRGPNRRLYRLTIVALAATVLVISLTIPVLQWHNTQDALARLAAAEAEADRLDPGWRMEDLEARREKVPDGENAALVVVRVASLGPKSWPPIRTRPTGEDWFLDTELGAIPIAHQAPGELLDLLRGDMRLPVAALDAARPLRTLHTGRYLAGVDGELNLNHLQSARAAANIVLPYATLKAHTGDLAGAVGCCRQAMAIARSYGDEPGALPALVRTAIASLAIARLERVLALGECGDADLRELQLLIQREESTPVLLLAMRGARASEHRLLFSERGLRYLEEMAYYDEKEDTRRRWTRRLFLSDQAWIAGNDARMLEIMNRAVEIAKLPAHEQSAPLALAELAEIQKREGDRAVARLQSALVRRVSSPQKIAWACQQSTARLRCADAALAIERYRLKHGVWPSRLDDLVPEFLAEVPIDPFTGERISFRRTEYGVVVYSFGPDGQDDGGDVAEDFITPRRATDLGFRLHDPRRRGMLPLPTDSIPPIAPASLPELK